MTDLDVVQYTAKTMSHGRMLARWHKREAHPVSPRIVDYVHCDDIWWRRSGGAWESIPDGPFSMSLYAGRSRLWSLTGGLDEDRRRDPWSAVRNRLRLGGACLRSR